jgi:hypothetical protein
MKDFLKVAVLLSLISATSLASESPRWSDVECVHHTDVNDDADMHIYFNETEAENIVTAHVSVRTSINNDENWFEILAADLQVAESAKTLQLDADDASVSLTIKLPLKQGNKPNGTLILKGGREFNKFFCTQIEH